LFAVRFDSQNLDFHRMKVDRSGTRRSDARLNKKWRFPNRPAALKPLLVYSRARLLFPAKAASPFNLNIALGEFDPA